MKVKDTQKKTHNKKEWREKRVRRELIGIVSCFVKPHPSSTKMEETFHLLYAFVFCPGM